MLNDIQLREDIFQFIGGFFSKAASFLADKVYALIRSGVGYLADKIEKDRPKIEAKVAELCAEHNVTPTPQDDEEVIRRGLEYIPEPPQEMTDAVMRKAGIQERRYDSEKQLSVRLWIKRWVLLGILYGYFITALGIGGLWASVPSFLAGIAVGVGAYLPYIGSAVLSLLRQLHKEFRA